MEAIATQIDQWRHFLRTEPHLTHTLALQLFHTTLGRKRKSLLHLQALLPGQVTRTGLDCSSTSGYSQIKEPASVNPSMQYFCILCRYLEFASVEKVTMYTPGPEIGSASRYILPHNSLERPFSLILVCIFQPKKKQPLGHEAPSFTTGETVAAVL